ncbi:MAG: acyl-CoA dehydrogenase [Gammaproteobacteria bacterium]
MTSYSAPTKDMAFVINELAELPAINQLPGFEDATADLVAAVLDEAARLASEVLAPLNQSGDMSGSRIEGGEVRTPEGFKEAYQTFVEAGWQGLAFDPVHGGQGLPQTVATAVNEMWQSANLAWSLCPMLSEGAIIALESHASEALKEQYLAKMISGEWAATMNLTEPQAGSDLAAIKTRAERSGDHYLITGQKIFITWGDQDFSENIIHLVLARIPDAPPGIKGISLFLVPKYLTAPNGTPGERNDVHPVSIEHKLGIHASPTCVMSYGDRGGAVGYLVGKEHNGIACMFTMMNHARLAVGLQGLSISERAYQQALGFARERVQGRIAKKKERVTIIHHPDVRRMLMMMKAGTEAMRALCYVTASSLDYSHHAIDKALAQKHSELFLLLTPVVKGWCSELAQELTSLGVQIHGGTGYIEETGAAQHFRDARITTIYEGTTGIQAMDLIGRKIINDEGKVLKALIADMRETARALPRTGHESLAAIHGHYLAGIEALEKATSWLLENYRNDPNAPGSVAFLFLMLTGTVCGGWQMARAALIADERLNEGAAEESFYKSKIVTSCFYAEHFLPRAQAFLESITAGSETVMALDNEQF